MTPAHYSSMAQPFTPAKSDIVGFIPEEAAR